MICSYCKTKLSCGCKKRTASDGTSCCQHCIKSVEAAIKEKQKK